MPSAAVINPPDSERSSGPGPTRAAVRWPHLLNPASLILVCAAALAVLGITILFSASWAFRNDPYFFVRRQVMWLGLAFVTGFIAARVNLRLLRDTAWWIAGLVGAGLIAVLIVGIEVNGSRRWIEAGAMRMQVSEFAKVGVVFVLAHYLERNRADITTFKKGFAIPFCAVAAAAGLIFLEPDYGTAVLLGTVGVVMMFFAGTRLRYLIPAVVVSAVAVGVAIAIDPERRDRILAFLDPEGSRTAAGYQLWQAELAFGAGGIDGVGLGNGRQQMFFLPEAHTDFIFPIVGEELGLVFTAGVVLTFAVIFIAGIVHLRRAPTLFHHLLVSGSLLLLTLQAIFNIGVVTGLLPTKGISLPFISYGGSNLMLMALVVGLMLNTQIAWAQPALKERDRGLREMDA